MSFTEVKVDSYEDLTQFKFHIDKRQKQQNRDVRLADLQRIII